MVRIGDIATPDMAREIVSKDDSQMTVTLTERGRYNLGLWFERYEFHRSVAGDADFNRAIDAFHLAGKSGRGILFAGGNGVGKTQAMRAAWQMLHAAGDSDWINCVCRENVEWLRTATWYKGQNIYLDDFGAERMQYGDDDIVGSFICDWYAQNPERRLFITTNLSSKDMNERYGGRVLDRIKGLCIVCAFKGNSKRTVVAV